MAASSDVTMTPNTARAMPDWLARLVGQSGLDVHAFGSSVGMAPPSRGYAGGSPTFNEAAGGTATTGQPGGVDLSRLYSGDMSTLNPNAPPIFRSSDFNFATPTAGQFNEQGTQGPSTGGWTTPLGGMDTNNWRFYGGQEGNQDPNKFGLQFKNAANGGMAYDYALDPSGKYYVPSNGRQAQMGGNTQYGSDFWAPVLTIGGMAAGASGLLGGAGAGGGAGVDATGGAETAIGGSSYGGAGGYGSAAAPGAAGGVEGGAGNGFLDSGGTMNTTTPGATGNGGMVTGGGTTGATTGGNGGSMFSQLSQALQSGDWSQLGSSLMSNPQLLGALGSGIAGLLGNNSLTGNASQAAQQNSNAYNNYSGQLAATAGALKAGSQFHPVGYTNASGGTQFDPATGTWNSSMSPEAQGQYNMWGQLGQQALGRYQNLNPDALASNYYNQIQNIQAPARQQALDSTLGTLKARGLLGQGVTDSRGASNNPLMSSLATANSQSDLQAAMAAQQYGQNAQQMGLNQIAGLYGQQQPLINNQNQTFNNAQQGTNSWMMNNLATNSLWANLMQGSAGATLNANVPNSTLFNSQQNRTGYDYGMWANLIGNLFKSPGQG